MKLFFDLGNSRCKWVESDGNVLQRVEYIEYSERHDEQRISECLQAVDMRAVSELHAVSVLGDDFDQALIETVKAKYGIPLTLYCSQQNQYGISLCYTDVKTYGNDRYAALVAAHHLVDGSKLVVDCGTATTIDAIDAQGKHQGGLIMPGVDLMIHSLVNRASGISLNDKNRTHDLLCNNTQDAVYSGCIAQMKNGVQGVIKKLMQQNFNLIVLTGGASELLDIENVPNTECIQKPHLVLEGVQIMQN